MRRNGWSPIALAMVLPVMLFTASCAKKVVRTETQTQAQPQAQAQPVSVSKPEVQKAPDRPAGKAKPDGGLEEVRLRAEADARLAALTAFVGENIHFTLDSSLLSDQARKILISKAEYLRTNPDITVTVEGHCDDRGTNAYNIALGERRAESVRMFLVDLGIGTNRLNTVSYGKERPIATGHNEASWAENRRAQFVIK
jgi:peptidoglycan-associated lipoprotein